MYKVLSYYIRQLSSLTLLFFTSPSGSTYVLLSKTDQCKCGPVDNPVLPTVPIGSPLSTFFPHVHEYHSYVKICLLDYCHD